MRLLILVAGLALSLSAQATLISVSGPDSNLGSAPAIIAAPASTADDPSGGGVINTGQQGFDEAQNVTLTSDLAVDGGLVSSGTTVDSHMIFLNTDGSTLAEHFDVIWEFSGDILGVMSDRYGAREVASSGLLGATGTLYPGSPFNARGLETSPGSCNLSVNDCYSVAGNLLTLTMRVTEPGDWIRVITRSEVPEPSSLFLMAIAGLGLVLTRRKAG